MTTPTLPGTYNITARQGSTLVQQITYTGVNLTGSEVRMMARKFPGDTTPVLSIGTLSPLTGIDWVTRTSGIFTLNVSATVMAAITPGEYLYDLEIVPSESGAFALLEGKFVVKAQNTR